jgi:transketolase
MRPAIRVAALMKLPLIYVFTHDSIAVGEDGPTHQPVEHLAALRAIPNLLVLRPCDANETVDAWISAIRSNRPPGGPGLEPPEPARARSPQGRLRSL